MSDPAVIDWQDVARRIYVRLSDVRGALEGAEQVFQQDPNTAEAILRVSVRELMATEDEFSQPGQAGRPIV